MTAAAIVAATATDASIGSGAGTVVGAAISAVVGSANGLPNSSTYTVRWMVSVTITVGCVAAAAGADNACGAGDAPCRAKAPTAPRNPEVASPVLRIFAAAAVCRCPDD